MRRVCVDTMILSWGIAQRANPEQQHLLRVAEAFLRDLQRQDAYILVPSVVIHELLTPLPPENHLEFLEKLGKGFMIVPHDLAAARWSARVWNKNGPEYMGELSNDHPELPFARRTVKADCLMIGTALAQKADCIYSHDMKHVKRLAAGFIDVNRMDGNLELDLRVADSDEAVINTEEDGGVEGG